MAAGRHAGIRAHGLEVTVPDRWEARLFVRDRMRVDDEASRPVLHLGNFALPPGRGDFGSGAVELMAAPHAFVALLEYSAAEAGTALFADRGIPRPTLPDFAPNALQRRLPGQLGCQRFFTHNGRAFCLYVVLGSRRHARTLIPDVHHVLDNVTVGAR